MQLIQLKMEHIAIPKMVWTVIKITILDVTNKLDNYAQQIQLELCF